ncbi:MAG TPA: WD40 repeat domain-containing protein [Candidatus Babeliales bacterium]|jgi:WD40 repeat protein|nr:WD40 repeat domain-containing protein [Candidatus Babeliales bacterium]
MLHHLCLLIIINFLITTSPCNAMREITGLSDPEYVEFLTKDHVAIQDNSGCNIFDITTNTKKQISDKRNAHLAVDQKKKKLALSLGKTVTIYDITTNTQKKFTQDKFISSSAFSASDETIFLHPHYSQQLIKYNYNNDTTSIFLDYDPNKCCRAIACHPKKNELCIACDIGEITTYNQDTCAEIQTITNLDGNSLIPRRFCEYSPNGLFIVSGGQTSLQIIDSQSYTHQILEETTSLYYQAIEFHPNSSVLAVTITSRDCIHYYDIRTLELIAQISELSRLYSSTAVSEKISFSPDGTQSIITLLDRCVILPVPFEVIYQTDTKQRLPYLLFLLNNFPLNEHNTDIIPFLMYTLVETFKR